MEEQQTFKFKQRVSEEIFNKKYKINGEKDVYEVIDGIGKEIASIEKTKEKRKKYAELFSEAIDKTYLIPAGRILANARPKLTLKGYINCFTIAVHDSIDKIYDAVKESALISKMGGGVGFNISRLRPKNALLSTGGTSSGPISFLKVFDMSSKVIHVGGSRRAATIGIMNIDHPDIEEFITCKQGDLNKELTQFNISVGITDEFMECVEKDKDWDLKWNGKIFKTVKARYLYDLLTQNSYRNNEPGVLFLDTVNKESNSKYLYDIVQVNPCFTGDTLVAVADGRQAVSFKQLAEEGKDIPVYAHDENTGELLIKTMRNPRITQKNQEIYEILLDDGSTIHCTKNHKFMLNSGQYKEAIDLLPGDSMRMTYKLKDKKGYNKIFDKGLHSNRGVSEHRFIYEQINKIKLNSFDIIHHLNEIKDDNRIENLKLTTEKEHHLIYHPISGDNNPVRRFPDRNWLANQMHDPEFVKNLMGQIHVGKKRSEETCRRIGEKTFERCKDPLYKEKLINSILNAWKEHPEDFFEGFKKRAQNYLESCRNKFPNYNFVIIDDTNVRVEKECPICGKNFYVTIIQRDQKCCSYSCSAKYHNQDNIDKLKKFRFQLEQEEKKKEQKVDELFTNYVLRNKIIPTNPQILELMNKNEINDFRSIHQNTYLLYLYGKAHDYNIKNPPNANQIRNNTNNCRSIFAQELINSGMSYNHKVVSVTKTNRIEDVYCGTVDDVHNFNIVTNIKQTNKGSTKMDMVWCHNCGEQCLPEYGNCDLSSIKLSSFVLNPFDKTSCKLDWNELEKTIKLGVRFLDNVLDITDYPIDKIKEMSIKERRIGLGFTGFGDMLIKMGLIYGSPESIEFINKLGAFFRDKAYEASIDLARERGQFPELDRDKYLESGFCKRLPEYLRTQIKEHGIRNMCILTVAPAGTQSLTFGNNCSSGIEPVFAFEYERTIRQSYETDDTIKEMVYDEVILDYKEYLKNKLIKESVIPTDIEAKIEDLCKKLPKEFVTSYQITPQESIAVQAAWQQYIDASISKTCQLLPGTTYDQYKEIYTQAYKSGLKGFTTYNPEGSLAPILKAPTKDKKQIIQHHQAPKRPIELPCDIYELTVEKQKFFILVGLLEGEPYEVFVDDCTSDIFQVNEGTKGTIRKIVKNRYDVFIKDKKDVEKYVIQDIGKSFDQTYAVITRLISTGLRYGTPIAFLVEQLQKSNRFVSFERALSRVLKYYIKPGEITENEEKCPECGSKLIYQEGCLTCSNNCGYSKCN